MNKNITVCKTKKQMAREYGVCWKTFDNLLKKHKVQIGRGLITPKEQQTVYEKLGNPNLQNK
ncbi:MAG: hypothetical protein IH591_03340 [Bacteroidales bacterium]|nr:hypothetical protein [Bacteroidales bacterium]